MELNWVTPKIIIDILDANSYQKKYIQNLIILNQCGLELKKLFTLCEDIYRGNTPKHVEGSLQNGALLLKTVNIRSNELDLGKQFSMTNSVYFEQKRFQLKENDICITIMGATHDIIGRSWVYNKKIGNACFSDGIAKIKNVVIDPYYLSTYLNSKYGHLSIIQFSGSSTRSYITNTQLGEILVPIPSPEIQKYVGDKVRKAEELREEAKTLQKEIDILLEVDMLLKEETDKVYNIYDSKINWTNEINIEDRIDPNFYQKKYISTIEKLGNNKVRLEKYVRITKIRYQTGNINKYIEISSINNSFGTIDEVEELRPEEIPTSAKYQVKEGDILVSLVRPTRKAISIVTKEYDNAICTGGFAVLQSKGKVPVEFLTAVLRTNFVGIQFERYCAGSTYPTINEDDVVKVFIPMYSENQINKITENYRRIIDNIYTSKKLIEEAKQDVEDLIEGNFDMSKVKANS